MASDISQRELTHTFIGLFLPRELMTGFSIILKHMYDRSLLSRDLCFNYLFCQETCLSIISFVKRFNQKINNKG